MIRSVSFNLWAWVSVCVLESLVHILYYLWPSHFLLTWHNISAVENVWLSFLAIHVCCCLDPIVIYMYVKVKHLHQLPLNGIHTKTLPHTKWAEMCVKYMHLSSLYFTWRSVTCAKFLNYIWCPKKPTTHNIKRIKLRKKGARESKMLNKKIALHNDSLAIYSVLPLLSSNAFTVFSSYFWKAKSLGILHCFLYHVARCREKWLKLLFHTKAHTGKKNDQQHKPTELNKFQTNTRILFVHELAY